MKLAIKYPPATRALLGAVLSEVAPPLDTDKLKQSLNPITRYKLTGATDALANAEAWNIE